jgi:sugar phosphate isomerase/epimerase
LSPWCRSRSARWLREVYTHSEKAGIRLAIEPLNRFETYLINRGDQALALADEVGPNCGICLDLFHMNIEESDLLEAFRNGKGRTFDVHIADNNRFAPGMGTLNFSQIVETIKSTGYDGALTLEFVATVDRSTVRRYGSQVETNPVDVSPEQMKFIIDHGSNLLSDKFYTGLFEKSTALLRPLI